MGLGRVSGGWRKSVNVQSDGIQGGESQRSVYCDTILLFHDFNFCQMLCEQLGRVKGSGLNFMSVTSLQREGPLEMRC